MRTRTSRSLAVTADGAGLSPWSPWACALPGGRAGYWCSRWHKAGYGRASPQPCDGTRHAVTVAAMRRLRSR